MRDVEDITLCHEADAAKGINMINDGVLGITLKKMRVAYY
jgi:hypothetical protein